MNNQREKSFELRRDGLGIVLFTAGAFFSVLLVLALANSESLDRAVGTAALARLWAGSIGLLPALVFCGGCAVLGAHLFLVGASKVRSRAGRLALFSLGLSVFLGAFSQSAGGVVGSLTAGALSRSTHVAVGALFGIAVLFGAVWVAWMRRAPASMESEELEPEAVKVASSPPTDLGVTAAEAAALIPVDLPSWRSEPRKEAPLPATPSAVIQTHRADVRRRGEVPEGARPILPPHVHTPASPGSSRPIDEPAASSVHHWTPPVESGEPADAPGEDLARAEEPETEIQPYRAPLVEIVDERANELADELVDEPVGEPASEPASEPAFEPAAEPAAEIEEPEAEEELIEIVAAVEDDELEEVEAEELEQVEEELAPAEEPEPVHSKPVLRPSWEQPTLFQEGEEPVDAYGTPLTLVAPRDEGAVEEEQEQPRAEVDATEDRDVVLKPAAAPAKKKSKARAQAEERSRFIAEVGCLFVDRGRVAVSMLQKQFDMDFEEATEVLDELQSLGLIGPYLGGQRRDILLTRDEWLEKVSSL
jgi:hypothetical protein